MAKGQAGQEGGRSQGGGARGVGPGISGRSRKALGQSDPQCSEAQEGATGGPTQEGPHPGGPATSSPASWPPPGPSPSPRTSAWSAPAGRSGAGAGGCSYEEGPRWGQGAPGLSLGTLVGAGTPKALPRGFPHSLRWAFLAVHFIDEETEARPPTKAEPGCQTPRPTCVASRVVSSLRKEVPWSMSGIHEPGASLKMSRRPRVPGPLGRRDRAWEPAHPLLLHRDTHSQGSAATSSQFPGSRAHPGGLRPSPGLRPRPPEATCFPPHPVLSHGRCPGPRRGPQRSAHLAGIVPTRRCPRCQPEAGNPDSCLAPRPGHGALTQGRRESGVLQRWGRWRRSQDSPPACG